MIYQRRQLNKPVNMTFTKPFISINAHATLGMIGLIVVGGDTSNMDAKSLKLTGSKSRRRDKLLGEI